MIVEKDTKNLVGILPYTKKSEEEMFKDLKNHIKLFQENHNYKNTDFEITTFTKIIK